MHEENGMISRRELLNAASGVLASPFLARSFATSRKGEEFVVEAMYYKTLSGKKIQCLLCPKECKVGNLERGYCGVRENRDGRYYTLVFGNPCAEHVDPIEKKPFFHFHPGSSVFSLSTAGCNLNCKYCQNWDISQARPEQVNFRRLFPSEVVKLAQDTGSLSIAGTYAEPVVFYEYMLEIAKSARAKGVKAVIVSSGYIKPEPLRELCRYLDAVKIDLKAFREDFYKEVCAGELKPVLMALMELKKIGIWFEIVYLVIPTLNDGAEEIKEMSFWIKKNLGADIPVHFTRFHPMYRLKNLPPTPVRTLEEARRIATEAGLCYVYVGNVPGHSGENTYCPSCRKLIIGRFGFIVQKNFIKGGKCRFCQAAISGVW